MPPFHRWEIWDAHHCTSSRGQSQDLNIGSPAAKSWLTFSRTFGSIISRTMSEVTKEFLKDPLKIYVQLLVLFFISWFQDRVEKYGFGGLFYSYNKSPCSYCLNTIPGAAEAHLDVGSWLHKALPGWGQESLPEKSPDLRLTQGVGINMNKEHICEEKAGILEAI